MGGHMAKNLLKKGHSLVVYDVVRDNVNLLKEAGTVNLVVWPYRYWGHLDTDFERVFLCGFLLCDYSVFVLICILLLFLVLYIFEVFVEFLIYYHHLLYIFSFELCKVFIVDIIVDIFTQNKNLTIIVCCNYRCCCGGVVSRSGVRGDKDCHHVTRELTCTECVCRRQRHLQVLWYLTVVFE